MSNVVAFVPRSGRGRRRPRRSDVVTYRVRCELQGTAASVLRRLHVASDVFLDDVHEVLQVAFGWTDSHLHRFASGPSYYSKRAEYYLMPFEVDEGEDGVPEAQVRLDEVLARAGDTLFYCYDFGDDWQHVIRLEAVLPWADDQARSLCLGGAGPSPAEDCGGVHAYGLLVALNDPGHPQHAAARAEYASIFGDEADPVAFAPTPFDQDAVNAKLDGLSLDAPPVSALPVRLAELVAAVRWAPARRELRRMIGVALAAPVTIDPADTARMARRYLWLLNRVGPDGIPLTSAGYLPPVHVAAAVADLAIDREWIGKGNREVQTLPVLELRETAQRAGLVRKNKGRLVVTGRGRALAKDPVALCLHLAESVPPRSRDSCAEQAGLLLLIAAAAGITKDLNDTAAEFLEALGWMTGSGNSLSGGDAAYVAADTRAVLRTIGGFERDPDTSWRQRVSADGVVFARAVLQRA